MTEQTTHYCDNEDKYRKYKEKLESKISEIEHKLRGTDSIQESKLLKDELSKLRNIEIVLVNITAPLVELDGEELIEASMKIKYILDLTDLLYFEYCSYGYISCSAKRPFGSSSINRDMLNVILGEHYCYSFLGSSIWTKQEQEDYCEDDSIANLPKTHYVTNGDLDFIFFLIPKLINHIVSQGIKSIRSINDNK